MALEIKAGRFYLKYGNDTTVKSSADVGDIRLSRSDQFFEIVNGSLVFGTENTLTGEKAYKQCSPLSLILSKRVEYMSKGIAQCVKDTKSGKEITAGTEVNQAFLKILRNPNPLQTFMQYIAQVETMIALYGYCPVLKVKASGFDVVSELWPLPPGMLRITENKKYYTATSMHDMIDKIEFIYKGVTSTISKEDVYFYTGKSCTIDNLLFPFSKVAANKETIEALIKNTEARRGIIEDRGALGIISNQAKDSISTLPLDPKEQKLLEDRLMKSKGLTAGQSKLIVTNSTLNYQRITMDMAELQLIENAKYDTGLLCDSFGFEPSLLSMYSDNKFDNKKEADRQQYENYIIPSAESLMQQTTECTGADAEKVKYVMLFDHIGCLQANEKDKAEVRAKNITSTISQFTKGFITYGRAMEVLEENESVKAELKNLFIWELPEEIQAIYRVNTQNNNQNQNTNG